MAWRLGIELEGSSVNRTAVANFGKARYTFALEE